MKKNQKYHFFKESANDCSMKIVMGIEIESNVSQGVEGSASKIKTINPLLPSVMKNSSGK